MDNVQTVLEGTLELMTLKLVGCSDETKEYWIDRWNNVNEMRIAGAKDGSDFMLWNDFAAWTEKYGL